MRKVKFSKNYKDSMKDVRHYPEYNADLLEELLVKISNGEKLPEEFRDHPMASNSSLKGIRGFHLRGNLVVLYRLTDDTLELIDIGKHNKVRLTSSYNI